jgi:predicted RNase H-like nuclease (RuvC/YqgF family)
MGLVGDIENYERNHKQLEQDLEREKQYTNEFAFKIIILSAEVERLSKEGGSGIKSKEFLELQESYSRLQSKVQSKNNEIDMLSTKIANLESK